MDFTYEDVHNAYVKLKTYIYYDSSNLFMRKQLAIFETDLRDVDGIFFGKRSEYLEFERIYDLDLDDDLELYERKLYVFTAALNSHDTSPDYFYKFLNQIKAKFLPKKIHTENEKTDIITNKRTATTYYISRSAVFIDLPIELHLISLLWILKNGVELDKSLFEGCYGNRLILNKEKTKVVHGSGLFKPYPKQYQKWRDKSVEIAEKHFESGDNVLILNLDIRDFFYSVRIPIEDIAKSNDSLTKIFSHIHLNFTEIIAQIGTPYDFKEEIYKNNKWTHYILPIGLLSSFVLANHYLVPFDNRILRNHKPVYYGRYVDDILMVIVNPVLPDEEIEDNIKELNFDFDQYRTGLKMNETAGYDEQLAEEDFDNLTQMEKFILKNFFPSISLIDRPLFLKPSIDNSSFATPTHHLFKINGYERLYCQSDKTLLYYFDKDESTLVIDKLKRDLEEKSSEFKNYSDSEGEEKFEESAYHLLYDGSEGKIRTLRDYKEDRFGLSVYLSKKIFNALRRSDSIPTNESEKLLRFFMGRNTLNLYTLWERLFVFFLVNKKADAYIRFYLNCMEAIKGISIDNDDLNFSPKQYQDHVFEYLDCASELALALNPKFLSDIKKVQNAYEVSFNKIQKGNPFFGNRYHPADGDSPFINRFRNSNLIRHHYVAQPLLSYTIEEHKTKRTNYTETKIPL